MRKMLLWAALLAPVLFLASAAIAVAGPDAQGWGGPGWYITGSAPPASRPVAAPEYVLFEGPHAQQSVCLEVYDRLYSPIGVCRFLDEKPAPFAG